MKTKIIGIVVLFLFTATGLMALDMSALKGLKKIENDVNGVKWVKYKSNKTPIKNFNVGSAIHDYDNSMFYLYIGIKEKKEAFLRMHVQLEPAVDWIKFNKIIITADDQIFEREFSIERLNTTVATRAQFLEFYDEEVMPHEEKMFETIVGAKDVTIRYQGENNRQEMPLKGKHKEAIKDILEAWKKLNA